MAKKYFLIITGWATLPDDANPDRVVEQMEDAVAKLCLTWKLAESELEPEEVDNA